MERTVAVTLRAAVFAAVCVCCRPVFAGNVYRLDASTSSGVDLTAMEGVLADRMEGPASGDITFSGPLVVDPSVGASNPFRLFGNGKKISVNASDSGFHAMALSLENVAGVTGKSTLQFDAGSVYSGDTLSVGKYNTFVFGYFNNGNSALECDRLDVHDGGTVSGYNLNVGQNRQTAVSVTGGSVISANYSLYLGKQTAATDVPVKVFVGVTNGTVRAKGSDKSIYLMYNVDSNDSSVENGRLVLGPGAVADAMQICHYGGGRSTIVFDGGRFVSNRESTGALFRTYGYSYNGRWPNPKMFLEGVNGHPIEVETDYDRILASGKTATSVNLTGDGGFAKYGEGTLYFTGHGSSVCEYTGPTSVHGGGIVVSNDVFKPGRGPLSVAAGAFLDVNGFSVSFTDAGGAGDIRNGGEKDGTLILSCEGTAGSFSLAASGVSVVKTGDAALTVSGNALANGCDLTVSEGSVVFTGDAPAYGTVTVAEGATLDIRGVRFGCAELVNYGTLLTDASTVLACGGSEEAAFNNGLLPVQGAFVKTGAGTLTLFAPGTLRGISVENGTLRCLPGSYDGRYFKLVMHKGASDDDNQWHKIVGDFSLYGPDREDLASGISIYTETERNPDRFDSYDGYADASGLSEGEICLGNSGFYTWDSGCGPLAMFDGDPSTIFNLKSGWGMEYVMLRLPDDSPAVVGYNFRSGRTYGQLASWALYGSRDGVEWELLDDRRCDWNDEAGRAAAIAAVPAESGIWYNGGIPYALTGYTASEGCAIAAEGIVSVAAGAVLDPVDARMTIRMLSVDCDAGAGTITRFTPASDGSLYLTGAAAGALREGFAVPIVIGETADAGAFSTWKVYVDGVRRSDLRVVWRNGLLRVDPRRGLSVVFR